MTSDLIKSKSMDVAIIKPRPRPILKVSTASLTQFAAIKPLEIAVPEPPQIVKLTQAKTRPVPTRKFDSQRQLHAVNFAPLIPRRIQSSAVSSGNKERVSNSNSKDN